MDEPANIMDISTIEGTAFYREEKFRTPLQAERAVGLWVDRIGSQATREKPRMMRVLGQYAAVRIEAGRGYLVSARWGRQAVRAGEVMVVFPDEVCMYYPAGQWSHKWIVWNGPEADTLRQLGYLNDAQRVVTDRLGVVKGAFEALSPIMASEELTAILKRKSILLEMILGLSQSMREQSKLRQTDEIMRQAVSHLREHFREDIEMEELGKRFHLSDTHFRRLFKQYMGTSPRQFVTGLRISTAKQWLSEGRPMKEVARLVGYEDLFYFMRVFKQVTGTTAGNFVRMGT